MAESSAAYILPDGATLSPDASWVSLANWQRVLAVSRHKFLPVCPESAVEVMSPSDTLPAAQAKMAQWLANGVQLGFLLHDEPEMASVYRPGQPVEQVPGFDTELSGEPVLPGFRLDLRELRQD